jgi:hypothetical protein
MVSMNSNLCVSGFHFARTTSELGDEPSGMNAISSPLPTSSGVGSRNEGAWAASGPTPAPTSRPPRQVLSMASNGCCGCSMRPTDEADGSVTRQKPALWSATHTRPSGSTIDPVEMCRPLA